jgi:pilus assembly protein Flp/PilA
MRKQFSALIKTFVHDERGASLLEYTILIGLISAAAVVAITTVGGWVSAQWATLQTNLGL